MGHHKASYTLDKYIKTDEGDDAPHGEVDEANGRSAPWAQMEPSQNQR